uniref:Uncharacterized protein n=1 Tax=Nelumbo nucifera TaxID=4432 RepID=A0A822Y6I0_NELNU|nr:TPA_asm: hypothetical protein HUJ06_028244 [Nelumbo nucifera]
MFIVATGVQSSHQKAGSPQRMKMPKPDRPLGLDEVEQEESESQQCGRIISDWVVANIRSTSSVYLSDTKRKFWHNSQQLKSITTVKEMKH